MMKLVGLLSLLMLHYACSGSGSISSEADLARDIGLKVSVLSGGGQAVSPRITYPEPVVFKVTDASSEPLSNVEIEYKLFNVTKVEELSADLLRAAWGDDNYILSADLRVEDALRPRAEVIGRIIKAPEYTDSEGKVSLEIDAPADFGQKIAVALRTRNDFGYGFGYTVINTGNIAVGTQALLISSTNQQTEVSGQPFHLFILVTDREKGYLETSFAESTSFEISTHMEGHSLATSVVPSGEIDCYFSGGRCQVSGGPFKVSPIGNLEITIKEKNIGFGESQTSINIIRGEAHGVDLALNPPGQGPFVQACQGDANDAANPCIQISADANPFVLFPVFVDKGGNYVGNTASHWQVTGVLAGKIEATEVAGAQNLYPDVVGTGKFIVTAPGGLTKTFHYEVIPGAPADFTVASEHANTETATEPFSALIHVFDKHGNFASNFNGNITTTVNLQNASQALNGENPVIAFNEVLYFTNGVGLSTSTVQAKNANDLPILQAILPMGTKISDPITINPGVTNYVLFRTQPLNAGVVFETPVVIDAQTTLTRYVAGYDVYGNYTEDTPSNFSGTGIIDPMISVKLNSPSTTIIPGGLSGTGEITATPINTSIAAITSPTIHIEAGAAVRYVVRTQHNYIETAGEPFTLRIDALDNDGILASNYNAQTIVFIEFIAAPSWTGQTAEVPTQSYLCDFSLTPGRCMIPNVVLKDARSQVVVAVIDPADNLDSDSRIITVQPGPPANTVVADRLGGPAAGALIYDVTQTLTLTADNTITLAAARVDSAGNYLGNDAATFVPSGNIIQANLTAPTAPATATSTQFSPGLVGTNSGSITVNGTSSSTLNFWMNPGIAADIAVNLAGNITTVEAGDCHDFTMFVTDAKGNATDYYNKTVDVKIGIRNGTSSPVQYFLDGIGHFTWQNDPGLPYHRVRFVTGFYSEVDMRRSIRFFDYDPTFTNPPYDYFPRTGYLATRGVGGIENRIVVSGQINFPYRVCFADATDVQPVIDVSLPATSVSTYGAIPAVSGSSVPITVNMGGSNPAAYVQLYDANQNWLCVPQRQFEAPATLLYDYLGFDSRQGSIGGGSDNTCYRWTADADPDTIYTRYKDRGGNDLGAAIGTWSLVPQMAVEAIGPTANVSSITLGNTKAGDYYSNIFTPQVPNSTEPAQYRFGVSAGPSNKFSVVINDNAPVAASDNFRVLLTVYDAFNNIADFNFQGLHTVNYSYLSMPNHSPLGTVPTISTSGDKIFTSGVHTSGYDFLLPKAHENVTLRVEIPNLPNPIQDRVLNIIPGPPVHTQINLGPNTNSQPVGSRNLSSDDSVTYYMVGYDSEGNWSAQLPANFSADGVLTDALSAGPSEAAILVEPYVTGSGTISAQPKGNYAGLPIAQTGLITVDYGQFNRFELTVDGTLDNTVIAGTNYQLRLRAVDASGNTILNFPATVNLNWSASGASTNPEGRGLTYPTSGTYSFVDGECTDILTVTAYNSSSTPALTVQHATTFQTGTAVLAVVPGPFHHYGVGGVISYNARYDNTGNSFTSTVRWRDEAGNNITSNGPAAPVTLTIVRSNGAAASGTLAGTTSGIIVDPGSGAYTVSDLSYQEAGNFKIIASDGTYTTPLTASNTINMFANALTVKDYTIDIPGNLIAGTSTIVSIRARDAYNNLITGEEPNNDISSLTFNWGGASSSPNGTQPTLPTTLTFASTGIANPTMTFYKAENITAGNLIIEDNQLVPRSGASTSNVNITAATLNHYDVEATPTANLKADNTTRFTVTIDAFDAYKNPRNGEFGITLFPVAQDGHSPGSLLGGTVNNINVASGHLTIPNLWYNAGGSIKFGVTGSTSVLNSTTLTFAHTINSVATYLVTPQSASIIAGTNNAAIQVTAHDGGGNVVANVDGALNSQTYTWSGATASPAPASVNPTYATSASFNNGVATFTHSLFNVQTIASGSLQITDNYSTPRSGTSDATLQVTPATANKMRLTAPGGFAKTAGQGFNITVTAYDAYDNIDTNYTSGNLTFNWTGTTPSPFANVAATVLASGAQTFVNGIFTSTTTPFNLYTKTDAAPTLNLSTPFNASLPGFTVTHNPTVDFVKIMAVNTAGTPYTSEFNTHTMTADQTKQLWSHGYDAWGNHIGLTSVNWTGTSALAGKLNPVTGTSSTVEPEEVGTGTVEISHATATGDNTGTFTITPGVATSFTVNLGTTSPVIAGVDFNVELIARDGKGNVAEGYNGNKNLTWTWNNATNSPAPSNTAPKKLANGNRTFVTGSFTSALDFALYNALDSTATLTVSDGTISGTSNTNLNVGPATVTKYRLTAPGGYSAVAGTGFNIRVTAYDNYDNIAVDAANEDLSFTWLNTTPTATGNTTPDVLAVGASNFVNGVYNTTGDAFVLYHERDTNSVLRVTGASSSFSHDSAAFTITHNSTVDFVKIHNTAAANLNPNDELDTTSVAADQTLTLYAHGYDQWGNYHSAASVTWSKPVDDHGGVAAGPATSTIFTPNLIGATTVTATHATATADSTGSITVTPGTAASFVVDLDVISPVTAGVEFKVTVHATDNKGNVAEGYSGSKNLTWTWNNATNSPAPSNTAPKKLTDGNRTFVDGVFESAATDFALYNALDTAVTLTVSDGTISGTSNTNLNTGPATAIKYRLTAPGGYSVVAGKGFNVRVTAHDNYDNIAVHAANEDLTFAWINTTPTAIGNTTPDTLAVQASGFINGVYNTTGDAFVLYHERDTNPILRVTGASSSFSHDSAAFTITHNSTVDFVKIHNTAAANLNPNDELDTTSVAADQTLTLYAHGYDQWGNYHSAASVTWSKSVDDHGSVAVGPATSTIFTPNLVGSTTITATHATAPADSTGSITVTPGTAASFVVDLDTISPVTAGAEFKVTVQALDNKGNHAPAYVGAKNLTWTWNNATNSPAPSNTAPKKLANGNRTFVTGAFESAATDFALYNALDTNVTLTVSDGTISGTSLSSLAVVSTSPSHYVLTAPDGYTAIAGAGFNVTVTAYDTYHNVATSASNETLTFSWQNTTPTVFDNVSPDVLAVGASNFVNGVYTTAGHAFVLYNTRDTSSKLELSGGTTGITVESDIFTVENSTTEYMIKIHDSSAADLHPDDEFDTTSLTADDTLTLYAHSYDPWGNYHSAASVTWSKGVDDAGSIVPGPATSTTFTPDQIGTTTITATRSALSDVTGTITVTPGNLHHFSVAFNTTSPVTAGEEFAVTVTARDIRGNTVPSYDGTKNLAWLWNNASAAPDSTTPKHPANGNQTFTNGVFTSAATDFALYNRADTAATLSVSEGVTSGTSALSLAVNAATRTTLEIAAIAPQTAGSAFNATAYVKDTYGNHTNVNCGTNLTISGGLTAPDSQVPVLPAAFGESSPGVYQVPGGDLITLYGSGTNNLTFSVCTLSGNINVTVTPAALNTILLDDADSVPANHLASISCTEGSTVSCDPLYAFGFDIYHNEIDPGSFSCASWSVVDNTKPAPGLSATSGHTTTVSSNTWHIDGKLRCTVGAITADTEISGRIHKTPGWSCGSWACGNTTPQASCTVTNNSGYDIDAFTFSGEEDGTTLDTTDCDTGLATGGSCEVIINGITGHKSGEITFSATANAPGEVLFQNSNAIEIQGGANAPECSNLMVHEITADWSCMAGTGQWSVTLTNDNDLNAVTFGAAAPTFDTANGGSVAATTCQNTSVTPGHSCTVTVANPNANVSDTLRVSPTDGFFQDVTVSHGSSPNCSQDATVSPAVVAACSGPAGNKTVRFTITNHNTLEPLALGAVTAHDGGVVENDNCSSETLAAAGDSCNVDVSYDPTPTVATDSNVSVTTGAYFNTIHLNTDISCP